MSKSTIDGARKNGAFSLPAFLPPSAARAGGRAQQGFWRRPLETAAVMQHSHRRAASHLVTDFWNIFRHLRSVGRSAGRSAKFDPSIHPLSIQPCPNTFTELPIAMARIENAISTFLATGERKAGNATGPAGWAGYESQITSVNSRLISSQYYSRPEGRASE